MTTGNSNILKEPLQLAISALEKQIPKKAEKLTAGEPIKIGNITFGKGTSIYECPGCGTLIARHYVYCNGCGQAIDWSVEE